MKSRGGESVNNISFMKSRGGESVNDISFMKSRSGESVNDILFMKSRSGESVNDISFMKSRDGESVNDISFMKSRGGESVNDMLFIKSRGGESAPGMLQAWNSVYPDGLPATAPEQRPAQRVSEASREGRTGKQLPRPAREESAGEWLKYLKYGELPHPSPYIPLRLRGGLFFFSISGNDYDLTLLF
jgi:hypothetical protein